MNLVIPATRVSWQIHTLKGGSYGSQTAGRNRPQAGEALVRKRGITLSQDNMREFGNVAKAIEVPVEELKQFAKPLMQELLDECFSAKQ